MTTPTNKERDKFLTESMGECWHEFSNNFSTWEGFGKLWEWAVKQEWFSDFLKHAEKIMKMPITGWIEYFVQPDRFADALYKFLKEKK